MGIGSYIPDINVVRDKLNDLETWLDYVDLVPVPRVSIASGTIRGYYGIAKVIVGLSLALFKFSKTELKPIHECTVDELRQRIAYRNELLYVMSGARSIARGYYVKAAVVSQFVLGLSKLGLAVYDYTGMRLKIWEPIDNSLRIGRLGRLFGLT